MDKNDLIIIMKEGDPMNKWIRVATSQIIAELQACPCCKNDDTEQHSSEIDIWYRCAECGCRWRIDYDKVKELAWAQVEEEKSRDPEAFCLGVDLSADTDDRRIL